MTAIVERNNSPSHFEIPEDSTFFKVLSCAPVLGAIPSYIQQSSLRNTIKGMHCLLGYQSPRVLQLIEVKNDYKKANFMNGILSIATAVALLSVSTFTAAGFILYGIVCAAVSLYQIHENKKLIEEIKNNGCPQAFYAH